MGANACNCSKGGSSPGDCACLDDKLSLLVAGAMSLGLVSWAVYSLRKRLREEPDASDPTAGTGTCSAKVYFNAHRSNHLNPTRTEPEKNYFL